METFSLGELEGGLQTEIERTATNVIQLIRFTGGSGVFGLWGGFGVRKDVKLRWKREYEKSGNVGEG